MPSVLVDEGMCKGCCICLEFCVKKVFEVAGEVNKLGSYPVRASKPELCVACMLCELYCPDQAVHVEV